MFKKLEKNLLFYFNELLPDYKDKDFDINTNIPKLIPYINRVRCDPCIPGNEIKIFFDNDCYILIYIYINSNKHDCYISISTNYIDHHVYSPNLTIEDMFKDLAEIALYDVNPIKNIKNIKEFKEAK